MRKIAMLPLLLLALAFTKDGNKHPGRKQTHAGGPSKTATAAPAASAKPSNDYNVAIGYFPSTLQLTISFHTATNTACSGNWTATYLAYSVSGICQGNGQSNSGSMSGPTIQPNVEQTMNLTTIFGGGKIKFIWPGSGSVCTVTCQPGSSPCP